MTTTIDIFADGETVEFEVEEFDSIERMIWASKAPDYIVDGDMSGKEAGPELVEYLAELTLEQTVLNEELLGDVPPEELNRLFSGVIQASFNGEVNLDERMDDGTHIPDDLFKDPEDFR